MMEVKIGQFANLGGNGNVMFQYIISFHFKCFKSINLQIVQALRALLIWRPNQGEGEQQPHSFVYRTRNTSIALVSFAR